MKFDLIVDYLGHFGPYQRRQFLLAAFVTFTLAVHLMGSVFTFYTPAHRCAIPGLENDTYEIQSPEHAKLVEEYIPQGDDGEMSKCSVYVEPQDADYDEANGPSYTGGTQRVTTDFRLPNKTKVDCSRWVYDTSVLVSTIVTQMGFVCGGEILKSHALMMFMCGQMIGCVFLGPVADVLGRKKLVLVGLALHFTASLLVTFSVNIYMLGVFTLINGLALAAATTGSYTIVMELIGSKYRHIAGIAVFCFWSFGMLWVCLISFLLRHWQHVQLAISCPIVLFVSYIWLLEESPRWLIQKGLKHKAEAIIMKAAKANNAIIPKELMVTTDDGTVVKSEGIFAIFKSPRILARAFIVCINWMFASFTYYGLSLNVGQLSGDIYINFLLTAILELVAYILLSLLLVRLGRKRLYCSTFLFGSLCCIATIFPTLYADKDDIWTVKMLAMSGKFGITCAFAIAWMFTSELFPTSLRASVMGLGSFSARIGAMIASYIAYLNVDIHPLGRVLPQIVFGTCGLTASLLALSLPETKSLTMTDTIQEISQQRRNRKEENVESGDRLMVAFT